MFDIEKMGELKYRVSKMTEDLAKVSDRLDIINAEMERELMDINKAIEDSKRVLC